MDAPGKRFVVDSMLGKVAKWLRILGFDTRYERLSSQGQIDAYTREGFLVITRNRRWCGQSRVFCPKANDSMQQLIEVIEGVPITPEEVRALHRCIRCNQLLQNLPLELAVGCVPEYVLETNTVLYKCPECHRVYWPGTHPERIKERLQRAVGWHIET